MLTMAEDGETNGDPKPSGRQGCLQAVKDVVLPFSFAGRADSEYEKARDCRPPPIFIPTISCVQVAVFIYYAVTMGHASEPVPKTTFLTYDPGRRREVWRLFTYMLIHAGWLHVTNNLVFQLLIGIPLEMVHKPWRVGPIYIGGVLAGSLETSIVDNQVYLVGASAGVYSLIAAHLADIIMNWSEMSSFKGVGRIIRLVFIAIYAAFDVSISVYFRYYAPFPADHPRTSFAAHIGGAIAGLLLGVVILRNLERNPWEMIVWWICLALSIACIIIAIFWNAFYREYPSQDV